jgi:hypothetical protein
MNDAPVLLQPHVRSELQAYLSELRVDDPRPTWRSDRERGMVSGIDLMFHFFFDDHDFDETEIGITLLNRDEARSLTELKDALDAVLNAVGDKGDDDFVLHPLWLRVRQAAAAASEQLARTTNGS